LMERLMMSSHTASRGSFRELVEATAGAGVNAIALTYQDYRRFARAGESDVDMVTAADDLGVRVADVEALFGAFEPDPDGRTADFADRLFRVADLFGSDSIGGHSNVEGGVDAAAVRLADLCDRAADHRLAIGIEPVAVMDVRDLATAWEIVARADRPNVGLVVDTWHFTRGAGSLEMIRSLPGTAFRTVQMSDGPLVAPPGLDYLEDTLANRLPPGEGEFDLLGIIRALSDIGAEVVWDMEICSTVLDALPGPEAARRAADATRRVLALASS
jgi:sugar phosphate isomerase/epimerase